MIKLRPSSLDRVTACPASLYSAPGEVLIDHPAGDAAAVGSAVHAILARVLEEGLTELPNVEEFAIAEDVPDKEEEIRILSYVGLKWINQNRDRLAGYEIKVEDRFSLSVYSEEIGEVVLSGTCDFRAMTDVDGRTIIEVWDYKTGQKTDVGADLPYVPDEIEDSEGHAAAMTRQLQSVSSVGCRQQMTAYALGAVDAAFPGVAPDEWPTDTEIIVRVIWLRDQAVSVLRFTPYELFRWWLFLPTDACQWDGQTYSPGDACRWCPRVAECPGRAKLYRSSIEALSDTTDLVPCGGGLPADPTAWGRAIQQARLLRGWIDDFLKASVTALYVVGGEVALPNGQRIILKERAGSASLDPAATIQRLRVQYGLTDEDLAQFVSVKKTGVEKFIGAHAERGEKGKLIKATLEAWEDEGILRRGAPARWVDVVSSEKEA